MYRLGGMFFFFNTKYGTSKTALIPNAINGPANRIELGCNAKSLLKEGDSSGSKSIEPPPIFSDSTMTEKISELSGQSHIVFSQIGGF